MPLFNSSFFPGHCEVARRLASRMNFPDSFVETVGTIYVRWDGKGVPPLKGEEIPVARLVAGLAQDVVVFHKMGGVSAAKEMCRDRSGGAHAPWLVDIFCRQADTLLSGLSEAPTWQTVLDIEPGRHHTLSEAEFDIACIAIADFTDIKSPYFFNHSRKVAELAAQAAQKCGLPARDVQLVRRAGYLHDIGKVGISAGIWGKSGALTEREWEKVRLHPYYTERVLARPSQLADIGAVAALHHERLDGSGYHRGVPATMLSPAARVLAAANTFCALTEDRAHRAALSPERAATELKRAVKAGRLDGDAVKAVCEASGQKPPKLRHKMVAGLSRREIEVLRLIAQGRTIKETASKLVQPNKRRIPK